MDDNNLKRKLRDRTRTPAVDPPSNQEDDDKETKSENLAHACGVCGKVYSREYRLRQHERLEHHVRIER